MEKRPSEADFISKRLRVLREQTGLTQKQFAERFEISYKVYQSMEAGRRWNLRYRTILELANFHGLSISDFFSIPTPASRIRLKQISKDGGT
jgi:transcriptional regulator with XRE-family HTH domain